MKKCSFILASALFLSSFQMVWADEVVVSEEPISNLTLEQEAIPEAEKIGSETPESTVSEELPYDFYLAGKVEESNEDANDTDEDTLQNSDNKEDPGSDLKNKKTTTKEEPVISSGKKSSLIQKFIQYKNRNTSAGVRSEIAESVLKASKKYNVRSTLITAVIWQESTFYPKTKTGPCYGLMQLHSAYSGLSASQMYHIPTNIDRGTAELASNLKRYNGNETLALTAYNWGTGNVARGNYNTKYARSVLSREQKVINFLKQ